MDSTVAAIPVYFGTMGAEYLWLRAHAEERGPTPADYERRDTVTSLTMGVGSLVAPFVAPKLLGPITPGKGRYGKALVVTAVTAAAATTVADSRAPRLGSTERRAAARAEASPASRGTRRGRRSRASAASSPW